MDFANPTKYVAVLGPAIDHAKATVGQITAIRAPGSQAQQEAEATFIESAGVEELDTLITHYGPLLYMHPLVANNLNLRAEGGTEPEFEAMRARIQADWKVLKEDLVNNTNISSDVAECSFNKFWEYLSRPAYRMRYEYLLLIIMFIRLIPVGSAECERIFSLMNRIKTAIRNQLSHGHLTEQMRVGLLTPSNPSLEWFDGAIDLWLADGNRYTGAIFSNS